MDTITSGDGNASHFLLSPVSFVLVVVLVLVSDYGYVQCPFAQESVLDQERMQPVCDFMG